MAGTNSMNTTPSPTSDLDTVALAVGLAAASFTPGLIILIVIVTIVVCVMVRRSKRPTCQGSVVQRDPEESMISTNQETTCQEYAIIAPLPQSIAPPSPQPYSIPITSHTPHDAHTGPPRPRLKAFCSRPERLQLVNVTRPIRYNEEPGEGDYSDAESDDRKCTPQEWIPKWKADSLREDSFLASGNHDLATISTTAATTNDLQISGDFGSLKTHKTDNPLSKITISYTATASEEKTPTAIKGKSLTTQESASSINTKKSSDDDGYCQWDEWNLPVPTGQDNSHASSDNEYINEGLGPKTSKTKTQTTSQSTSDESIDGGSVTTTKKATLQTEPKSGGSDNDEYYVNEGLGPKTKKQDKKAKSETKTKDNKSPSPVTKQQEDKKATTAEEEADNDSCDDDGYFVMESLQKNQLQTSVKERPPPKETWVPREIGYKYTSYKSYTLNMKRYSEPNPAPQFGRSNSIENFASKSAYARREASFSTSSYDASKYRRPFIAQRHYPSAANMGSCSRHSAGSGATTPATTPEKHAYEYIQVPKKKGASYLQSVSEWMESQGLKEAEPVATETTDPVDGTLV